MKRPILSVSRLLAQGFVVHFGGADDNYIKDARGRRLDLAVRRGVFTLPGARSKHEAGGSSLIAPVPADGALISGPGARLLGHAGSDEELSQAASSSADGGPIGQGFPSSPAGPATSSAAGARTQSGEPAPKLEAGSLARPLPTPPAPPSAEEAERHALTHVPHAPCCDICRTARAKENPHRAVDRQRRAEAEEEHTQVQADYTFATEGGHNITIDGPSRLDGLVGGDAGAEKRRQRIRSEIPQPVLAARGVAGGTAYRPTPRRASAHSPRRRRRS